MYELCPRLPIHAHLMAFTGLCFHAVLQCPPPHPPLSHLFMLTQEVSKMPISLSTPSKMTLMTSGGMRRERISDSASGLMFPTARFASSTKGYRAEIIRRHRGEEGIGVCMERWRFEVRVYTLILTLRVVPTSYLHFLQLVIYFGLSLFNLWHLLSHLPFNLFHFCLLVTGILSEHKRSGGEHRTASTTFKMSRSYFLPLTCEPPILLTQKIEILELKHHKANYKNIYSIQI